MKRAVLSILDQTYPADIEIIVVFDACDPVLPDVDLPPNRSLRALVNNRARGLAGARNTGITAAAHDFVAFLDDDDHWLPGKLEQQMSAFDDNPAALLVGTAMVIDSEDRAHERLVPAESVTYPALLRKHPTGLHSSSFVFRTHALRGELGLVDEVLPRSYGEDYDLLLRTAKISPIVVVNVPLVTVTWQGQSYFFGKWAAYAESLRYLLEKHQDFASNGSAIGRIESQIAFALAASGQRTEARQWALRSIRHDFRQVKAYLAIAISIRVVSAQRVIALARRFGKGI